MPVGNPDDGKSGCYGHGNVRFDIRSWNLNSRELRNTDLTFSSNFEISTMVKFANFAVFALGACQVASAVPLKWFKTIGDSVVKIWPLQVAGDAIESTSAQLGNPDKAVMDSIHTQYIANTLASLPLTGSCTAANIVKRKEW